MNLYCCKINVIKSVIFAFFILSCGFVNHLLVAHGQSETLSFSEISIRSPDITAPGRGANAWYSKEAIHLPGYSLGESSFDNYFRFLWGEIELKNGEYNWEKFDSKINETIKNGQKLSFGLMPVCSSCSTSLPEIGGARLQYPVDLHEAMQLEVDKDIIYEGNHIPKIWLPNWNSREYLKRFSLFLQAVSNHLDTGNFRGFKYKEAILNIDVRGYGNWGEWHNWPWTTSKKTPEYIIRGSDSSLKQIINGYLKAFPKYQLISMVNGFTQSSEDVAFYLLSAKNEVGYLGWRSDHLGNYAAEDYPKKETKQNSRVYRGISLKDLILERWRTAPIIGEPLEAYDIVSFYNKTCGYYNLEKEVTEFHISQFSNGNIANADFDCVKRNIIAASKAAGYRLLLTSGSITSSIKKRQPFTIGLVWENRGVAPTYETWEVKFLLKTYSTNNVVWEGKSKFSPTLFLPGKCTVKDTLSLPNTLAKGRYTLSVSISDPSGYRKPLPLAIEGRHRDGSYLLTNQIRL